MSDPTVLAEHIRATWFGSDLPEASLLKLGGMAREYEAPARTRLLREGDETDELSILVEGRIALTGSPDEFRQHDRDPILRHFVAASRLDLPTGESIPPPPLRPSHPGRSSSDPS